MKTDQSDIDRETRHAAATGECVYHGKNLVDCRGCWLAQTGKAERPNVVGGMVRHPIELDADRQPSCRHGVCGPCGQCFMASAAQLQRIRGQQENALAGGGLGYPRSDGQTDSDRRSQPTERPGPDIRRVQADDLRARASRLWEMGKKLINESSDLRAAADRIEAGQ